MYCERKITIVVIFPAIILCAPLTITSPFCSTFSRPTWLFAILIHSNGRPSLDAPWFSSQRSKAWSPKLSPCAGYFRLALGVLAVEISVIMCSSWQTGPSIVFNTTTKARRVWRFSRIFDTLIMWLVSTHTSSRRLQSASSLLC